MLKRSLIIIFLFVFLVAANDDCVVEEPTPNTTNRPAPKPKKQNKPAPPVKYYQIQTLVADKLYAINIQAKINQPITNPSHPLNQGLTELGRKFDIQSVTAIANDKGMTASLTVFVKAKQVEEIKAEIEEFVPLTEPVVKKKNFTITTLIPSQLFSITANGLPSKTNPVGVLNKGLAELCEQKNCQAVTAITNAQAQTIAFIVIVSTD